MSAQHFDPDLTASLPTQGEDSLGVVEGADLEAIEVLVLAAEPGVVDDCMVITLGERQVEA